MSIELYLDPQAGNDSNNGQAPHVTDVDSDGPLQTLPAMLQRIKAIRAQRPCPELIVVTLAGGVYPLLETLIWKDAALSYVTVRAAEGADVTIRGAERLSDWETCEVNGVAAWKTILADAAKGDWYFRSLFVANQRRPRARLPKFDTEAKQWDTFTIEGIHSSEAGVSAMDLHVGDHTFRPAKGDVQDWPSLADAEAVVLHYWVEERLPNLRLDPDTGWLRSSHDTCFNLRAAFDDKLATYYIDNLFEALTEPGEWYLKRGTGELFYIPHVGESMECTEIYAPRISQFIQVNASIDEQFKGCRMRHVSFEGLCFEMADWQPIVAQKERADRNPLKQRPIPCALQNAAHVPGLLSFTATQHGHVEGCSFSNIGFYAVAVEAGCADITLTRNDIRGGGAGGIKVLGGDGLSHASQITERITITDNKIHGMGRVYHSGSGIVIAHASRCRVSHNHISDIFYSGIACGMVWSYVHNNQSYENDISFNHIHHYGQGLLSDMGGIYMLGVQQGTQLQNNWIHDAKASEYGAHGIYLDDSSGNMVVRNNVVHDCAGAAFLLHKGRDNLVSNNLFATRGGWTAWEISNQDTNRGLVALRNIIITDGSCPHILGGYGLDIMQTSSLFEANLYWGGQSGDALFGNVKFDKKPHFEAVSLKEWQASGRDCTSLEGNPELQNLGRQDFQLAQESVAVKCLGFCPISLESVGPRAEGETDDAVVEKVSVSEMKF